jgi:NDP-sugar pyrophosphorylase family protein
MQETIKTSPKTLLEDLTKKIYELVLEAKTDYRFKKFVVSILRKNDVLREDAKTKAQVLLSWLQKNIRPYYVPDGFRVENVKSPHLMEIVMIL